MSIYLQPSIRFETLPSQLRVRHQMPDSDTVPSRYTSRFLERVALVERLASGPAVGEAFPPPTRLDTARVMTALAPVLVPDAPGCFAPTAPDVSVRRTLAPLPRGRSLAIDVVPATVRFDFGDLSRLLQELVDNACQHAPAGATVRVRGAPGVGGYQISVTNPGEALPRWALAALRPGRPAASVGDPTGLALGLPISALLAAVNGARLEVLRGAGRPNTLRVITRAG
jgi:signal transduction histidine kinase